MGCSEPDSGFEIAAHTHGQSGNPVPLCELLKQREMKSWFFIDRRNAHQPFYIELPFLLAPGDEIIELIRDDARPLRILARIDPNEETGETRTLVPPTRQRVCKLHAIEHLQHIQQANRLAYPVGLERSEAVS